MTRRLPKSLLLVRDYFPPQVGGISDMMAAVCQTLGSANISCVTAVDSPHAPLDFSGRTINVRRIPSLFAQGSWRTLLALGVVWPRLLATERPALLQFATCQDAYWGLILKRLFRLPFVVYAHGNEVLEAEKLPWPRPREALRAATRVIANSRFTANLLTDRIKVEPSCIRIVHPGCDTRRFSVDVSAEDARTVGNPHQRGPILLSVGNLVERKGHALVLRALPKLTRRWPNLVYVIAGEGPFRPSLLRLVGELGIERSVHFVGHVEPAALPSFYRMCDVFVMPSRFLEEHHDVEGFGIVYLEAGACGKPVVGGRSGGTADAIVEGETGLLVDPTDPDDVAAALARLLENPALAKRLGQNARERVLTEYTWEAFARRLRHEIMDPSLVPNDP